MGSFDYSANGMALAEGAERQRVRDRRQGDNQDAGRDDRGREFLRDDRHGRPPPWPTVWTTEQWEKMIVAHPSLCEMVREAALDAFGKSVHK